MMMIMMMMMLLMLVFSGEGKERGDVGGGRCTG